MTMKLVNKIFYYEVLVINQMKHYIILIIIYIIHIYYRGAFRAVKRWKTARLVNHFIMPACFVK